MLNFDFLEKGLGIVFPSYFVYETLKAFIKPSEAPQRSVKIKI